MSRDCRIVVVFLNHIFKDVEKAADTHLGERNRSYAEPK